MKTGELWEAFNSSTLMLSRNTQTFSIAAIALVWVFHTKDGSGAYSLPPMLLDAIYWIVVSVCLDFSQYIYKSILFYIFTSIHESNAEEEYPFDDSHKIESGDSNEAKIKKYDSKNQIFKLRYEKEIEFQYGWNVPTNLLFAAKLIALVYAYFLILLFLSNSIQADLTTNIVNQNQIAKPIKDNCGENVLSEDLELH